MRCLRIWRRWVILFCIVMTAGCSTLQFAPRESAVCARDAYTADQYKVDSKDYETATTLDLRTTYRNKIVYLTAGEIDKNYYAFRSSFFAQRARTETAFDIVQTGLGTAGTLAAGESVKAILAAIATGVSGSRLSLNKNFFKEKAPEILISRMDALRTEQWSLIYLKLKDSTDKEYSLYEAERDLVAYYQAGSIQAAIQDIIVESGDNQTKANNEIRQAIQKKYGLLLGRLAPEAELREMDGLWVEFDAMPISQKESQAGKILKNFIRIQPGFDFGPNDKATDLEKVTYLYIVARDKDHRQVRDDLTRALKEAKSQ